MKYTCSEVKTVVEFEKNTQKLLQAYQSWKENLPPPPPKKEKKNWNKILHSSWFLCFSAVEFEENTEFFKNIRIDKNVKFCSNFYFGLSGAPLDFFENRKTSWKARGIFWIFLKKSTTVFTLERMKKSGSFYATS